MLKVMLIDDEVYVRKGLLGLIDWGNLGYQAPLEADNGQDALQIIANEQPDVVITDIRMPIVDGLQLIEEVKKGQLCACKFIILSGYNDFTYAQSAIRFGVSDYILKPIDEDELEVILRDLAEQIKQERSQKLLAGRQTQQSLFEQVARGEQAAFALEALSRQIKAPKGTMFRYGIIELNAGCAIVPEGDSVKVIDEESTIREALHMLLGETLECVAKVRNHQAALLITSPMLHKFGGNLERFAEALKSLLSRRLQIEINMYLGQGVKEMKLLGISVQTAVDAMKYKYVKGNSGLFIYENVQQVTLSYTEPDAVVFHNIKEAAEEQEMDRLTDSIQSLFNEMEAKMLAKDAIRTIINRYVHAILGTLQNMQGRTDLLQTMKPMLGWDQYSLSYQELQTLFSAFMTESSVMIEQLRGEQSKGNIHKIKSYIELHYQESINLKSIAAQFYMNPVYVGQLFKKKYGMYFNEFLLSIRIAEAKKLLRQTDLRIYEIAGKIGFNNADYFVAQFEKLEGMPPSEYRKHHLIKRGGSANEKTMVSAP